MKVTNIFCIPMGNTIQQFILISHHFTWFTQENIRTNATNTWIIEFSNPAKLIQLVSTFVFKHNERRIWEKKCFVSCSIWVSKSGTHMNERQNKMSPVEMDSNNRLKYHIWNNSRKIQIFSWSYHRHEVQQSH